MTKHIERRLARTVLASSIAAIGLAAHSLAGAAEGDDTIQRLTRPDSSIELGIGSISDDSFKFGDFEGTQDSGAYGIANFRLIRRGENNANFVDISGRNLGLNSRNLTVDGGEQGNFGLRLEYDELPKLFSDSYQTPFANPSDSSLNLPAGWVRGATTAAAAMTGLNANMKPFQVETLRKSIGLGLTKLLPSGWDVAVNFKRETKQGNRFIGATLGNSGGNPRAAILPEPVDYNTDQFEAIARYTAERLDVQVGYYGSFFKNDHSALAWANPYSGGVWNSNTDASAFPNAQIGLPPDNQFHQLNASAGYSYSKDTRVTSSFSYGRMTQNDVFLPYSINPLLLLTGPALPRSSLDGSVKVTHLDFKLTSKLMPKLKLLAAYRYDDRDNETPQAEYRYPGGDSQTQAAAGNGKWRTNLPGSSTKQQVEAELDYHLGTHTKLKGGYDYEWVKKTYEAIDSEREHTVKAGIDHRFGDRASGGLSYAFSDRETSTYDAGAPYLASYNPANWNANPALRWDNLPQQKKFFLAPRKRDKVRAHVNVAPTDALDLQFGIDYKTDDYHTSEYGLQEATGWAANFEGSLAITDALSGNLYATVESYETKQRSLELGGSQANYTRTDLDWTADIDDRTFTAGFGLRYKPGGRYEFGTDFTHAYSVGKIDIWTAPGITNPATALPDLKTKMSRVDLFGKYEVKKDVTLQLKYVYERFSSSDWAYDGVLSNTMANVIGTNQTSPDYKVHAVGASVIYKFQ